VKCEEKGLAESGGGSNPVYEFGAFMLDPGKRRLSRAGGETVAITAKAFDALVHLVEHAGETIPRAALGRALWPNVVVEDNNLSQTILALRRGLGESADGPQFIVTIPRGGYRFIAEVVRHEAPAAAIRPPAARRGFWLITASVFFAAAALPAFFLTAQWRDTHASPGALGTRNIGTASMTAYGQYLKAMALYRAQGGIGVSLAQDTRAELMSHLDEALRVDPAFPEALAWKAHAQLDQLMFDAISEVEWPAETLKLQAQIEAHARQSLAGDRTLGVAHTTLARLAMYRGQFEEARDHLRRALQSSPNDSMVLHYTAMLHCLRDEHDDAIRIARRAIEADPHNPAPWSPLVLSLTAKGERVAAAAAARRMIEVAPTAAIGYVVLARTQTGGGAEALAEARESLRIAEQFLDELRNFRVDAALSYTRAGGRAHAARLVNVFREGTRGRHVDPALEAMAHLALGEYDRARERLEYATAHRERGMDPVSLLLIRRNAWSDPQLESAQWRALRERLG
jgi:DNA-binding winged helix-turn-helix (wHTH) protein/tetratricopeptide (TPR) repeat protein